MKNGSQQSTNTTTITTTIRVTLRSERRRLVKPARAPEDFTCGENAADIFIVRVWSDESEGRDADEGGDCCVNLDYSMNLHMSLF